MNKHRMLDGCMIYCCPNCNESYYAIRHSTTTCLGWTPIYKDGVLMNNDPNKTINHCKCLNCGKDFTFET